MSMIQDQPSRVFEVEWPGDLARFCEYRQQIHDYYTTHLYWKDIAEDLVLSLDEAMANIVLHAYDQPTDRTFKLSLSIEDVDPTLTLLTMTLRDQGENGTAFDPSELLARAMADHDSQAHAMGFGIIFLHRLMDDMTYECTEGENRLVLRKWICNRPTDSDYLAALVAELQRLGHLTDAEPDLVGEITRKHPDLEPGQQLLALGTLLNQPSRGFRKAILQARVNLTQAKR